MTIEQKDKYKCPFCNIPCGHDYCSYYNKEANMDNEVLNTLYADNDKLLIDSAVNALKAMDWTYEYSDDSRVWNRGKQLEREMKSALSKLPKSVASILWDEYCKFKYTPKHGGYKNPYRNE